MSLPQAAGPHFLSATLHWLQQSVPSRPGAFSFLAAQPKKPPPQSPSTPHRWPDSATALLSPVRRCRRRPEAEEPGAADAAAEDRSDRGGGMLDEKMNEPCFVPFGTVWSVAQALRQAVKSQRKTSDMQGLGAERLFRQEAVEWAREHPDSASRQSSRRPKMYLLNT